ncbi:hypothetical protein ACQZV8_18005 [Magnetococcales bacterium HHB-1]
MDVMVHFPDEIGQQLQKQPDLNDFIVKAAQMALEEQMIAQRLTRSQEQSDRGEDATEEVEAFFAKWNDNEG